MVCQGNAEGPDKMTESDMATWLLWILGGLAIFGRWMRLVTPRAGWLGVCALAIGALASWPRDERWQTAVALAGLALVLALGIVLVKRGELVLPKAEPGDYEAELIRLCHGNRERAERYIQEERKRSPELSRVGAAMAAVTRLRYDRDGYPPPL